MLFAQEISLFMLKMEDELYRVFVNLCNQHVSRLFSMINTAKDITQLYTAPFISACAAVNTDFNSVYHFTHFITYKCTT